MTSTAQDEFIQALDGVMNPQQAAQFLAMGEQGDSSAVLQPGGEPGASTVGDDITTEGEADKIDTNKAVAVVAEVVPPVELNATNAVITAKDGVHTISYDKLVEAREGERLAKQELQLAQTELGRLKEEAQQRANAGLAPTDQDKQLVLAEAAIAKGVDISLFGDFSEAEVAKGIQTLVGQLGQQIRAEVVQELAPLKQKDVATAADAHTNAIYNKHPDADSIFDSTEFANWKAAQPAFARAGLDAVLKDGSSQQIIELFDSFKNATGFTQAAAKATAPAVDVKAVAKAAIANTPTPVPASLTDFPAGRVATGSREDAMDGMSSGVDLLGAMSDMTAEQVDTFLNRSV